MSTQTSEKTMKEAAGFSPKLLDELIGEATTAQELLGSSGLLKELGKALLERMLEGVYTILLTNPFLRILHLCPPLNPTHHRLHTDVRALL